MSEVKPAKRERVDLSSQRVSALARGCLSLGVVALLASAVAARGFGRTTPSLTFGGRIFAADAGSLAGVRVVATDARGSYEAVVDSSGLFVGEFPSAPAGRLTLRVFMDSSPRYHASVVSLDQSQANGPTRIVLVPTRWNIRGGTYTGREVRIDPLQATTRFGGTGFWRLTRRGRTAGRAVTWVTDSIPIRIAFRRERNDPSVSASDSSEFWAMAEGLERRLGQALFRPASFEEIDGGADGILVAIDRRMFAAGRTFITYDTTGRIYEALVSVSRREYLGDSRVAMHELLHAIGLGHTNAWTSVMSSSTRGVAEPTAEDVAYTQLYYAIAALQREREAPHGIIAAAGEIRY